MQDEQKDCENPAGGEKSTAQLRQRRIKLLVGYKYSYQRKFWTHGEISHFIIEIPPHFGLLADAVTPEQTCPLRRARTSSAKSPIAGVTGPPLKQPVYGAASAIRPNARCIQSQPYHQSCIQAQSYPTTDEYVHDDNNHSIAQEHIQADSQTTESNDPNTRILWIWQSVPRSNSNPDCGHEALRVLCLSSLVPHGILLFHVTDLDHG